MPSSGVQTSKRMKRQRIRGGERFPFIAATGLRGAWVCVPDGRPGYLHVQFSRFAGCPIGSSHLRAFVERHEEIEWAGIREVVVLRSEDKEVEARHHSLPFDVIGDPDGFFHEHCGVSSSWSALWNFDALDSIFGGIRAKDRRFYRWAFTKAWFALPADFLLSGDGIVKAVRYGRHAGDQWSVDDLLAFRRLVDR
jgi:hypothetical protein